VLDRLARWLVARRRLVVLVWAAVLVVGGGLGGKVFDHLGETSGMRADAESVVAEHRLEQLADEGPEVFAFVDGRPATDRGLAASVTRVTEALRATPGVVEVDDFYHSPGPWVSGDLRSLLVRVELARNLPAAARERLVDQVARRLATIEAPRVVVGGKDVADKEFADQAMRDLAKGEAFSLPVLLLALLLVFGGALAAAMPLAVALVSIAATLLALLLLSAFAPVSEYSVNVVTLLGLGLAVDYSLLQVARFREERAAGAEVGEAVARTLAGAGRTVCFSGLTVAAALSGMLLFAEPLFRSMALAGMTVVLLAVLAAVTLLPALLAIAGGRLRPVRRLPGEGGAFARVARLVQRRAGLTASAVAVALAALAWPFAHANLGDSGVESLPRSSASRQLDAALADRFGRSKADPVVVLAETRADTRDYLDFLNRLERVPGVRQVAPRLGLPSGIRLVQVVDLTPEGTSKGRTALAVVRRVRALGAPFGVQVTGTAASLVDYRDSVGRRLPLVVLVIGVASFVLLFCMTGSVVVPAKAIVMNLLSLGASLGALVWVFQDGHLAWLLGFEPVGAVDLTIPVLVFVFTFGLSMDYEVFLLARIKEVYDEAGGGSGGLESEAGAQVEGSHAEPSGSPPVNSSAAPPSGEAGGARSPASDRAVAVGLERTGRVVTAAAALMVVVFLGFAVGELLPLKAMGVGMIVAIVLDATVVRLLLVPATMTLLGHWNWWAPAPLRRLRERLAPAAAGPPAVRPESPTRDLSEFRHR
jgi:RND superfamily putative drug exporter